jgi:hypothetical protein
LKVQRDGRNVTVEVTSDGEGLVSHAGSALLSQIADKSGLTQALSVRLADLKQRQSGHDPELYPDVVDGDEEVGGVPSRLIKTDAGVGRQEGTPWWMFAGSPSGRTTRSRSRSMSSRAKVRAG